MHAYHYNFILIKTKEFKFKLNLIFQLIHFIIKLRPVFFIENFRFFLKELHIIPLNIKNLYIFYQNLLCLLL